MYNWNIMLFQCRLEWPVHRYCELATRYTNIYRIDIKGAGWYLGSRNSIFEPDNVRVITDWNAYNLFFWRFLHCMFVSEHLVLIFFQATGSWWVIFWNKNEEKVFQFGYVLSYLTAWWIYWCWSSRKSQFSLRSLIVFVSSWFWKAAWQYLTF